MIDSRFLPDDCTIPYKAVNTGALDGLVVVRRYSSCDSSVIARMLMFQTVTLYLRVMGRLYRYTEREYADRLLSVGSLRVGTLHDFRREEHKGGIADRNEGRKTIHHKIDKLAKVTGEDTHSPKSKDEEALEAFSALDIPPGITLDIENVTLFEEFDKGDCFLLCMSHRLSRETMRQFEGADTCIEIHEPNPFFRELTKTLTARHPVKFMGAIGVEYQERSREWSGKGWGVDAALIKEPEFHLQYEVRAGWRPLSKGPIEPLIIENPELTKHCRIVDVPKA